VAVGYVLQDGGLQCPTCKSIYGVKRGDCPDGTMSYHAIGNQLPGFDGCGAIEIIYNITGGYRVMILSLLRCTWCCKIKRITELSAVLKNNYVKNFNAGNKSRKPAVPTVNTNIPKSNVSQC